jgi:hypothetical protein
MLGFILEVVAVMVIAMVTKTKSTAWPPHGRRRSRQVSQFHGPAAHRPSWSDVKIDSDLRASIDSLKDSPPANSLRSGGSAVLCR